jgi:hypothetical protein
MSHPQWLGSMLGTHAAYWLAAALLIYVLRRIRLRLERLAVAIDGREGTRR